jgi:hypothetical protein
VRHPGAYHPGGLGHIDGGDPLEDLLGLLDLDLDRWQESLPGVA